MTNREIAAMFERVAAMLSIRGDQFHRVLAYQRAAENIRELTRDLGQINEEGALTSIPSIGTALELKIQEMLSTGSLGFYEKLSEEIPPSLVDMLRIDGLGPKRVGQIYRELKVTTIEELSAAAAEGKLRSIPGMGAKSEAKIIAGIEALAQHGDARVPLGVAWPIAQEMLEKLRPLPGVEMAAVGGSLRRMKESTGDIDLLVAAEDSKPVMDFFVTQEQVESIQGHGPTKSSVVLLNGIQVDLRILPSHRWGTLLSYFTGSKQHNVRLRELALKQGMSLNEHAFTPVEEGPKIICAEEEAVYETLGLPYIPPVLREDHGEIEAAINGELPELIEISDIKSDLHLHSTWSDGLQSILEMAQAAKERGLSCIAITDHSVSLGIANGLSVEQLYEQQKEVRAANEAMGEEFTILHGSEVEIRADGTLDFPDEVLADLDIVIASIHLSLRQPREVIMPRLIRAMSNPYVDIIAHPTGRLIPDRPPMDLDMEEVFQTALQTGTILEVNANPSRLDLRDSHIRRAVELGVKIAINSDAHNEEHYDLLHFGVATAQRGWAGSSDVINTLAVATLLPLLRKDAD
jgi:DNA polymerase (family 10)